jgi:hypothetical protein
MNDIRKVSRIILLVGVVFICNKFLIRPFVLANDFPEIVNVIVLSLPNLCEAIIGALLLTNIGLLLRHKYLKTYHGLKEGHVYLIAVAAATIYVSLQELKFHNLGGRNVYDPFDLLFSIIGIAVAYGLLVYLKPRIYLEQEN